ncbi:hypothetical protein [Mucilaginibacter celer]|uniref:hypothetical protein n=1 Tax=Mucilaginibacter celer TaxID=2305508 RepID=UPI0013CE461F|nr:hypothetical protein [Mucilaginibacter celer]
MVKISFINNLVNGFITRCRVKKSIPVKGMVKPDKPHLFFNWRSNDKGGGIKTGVKKGVNSAKNLLTGQKLSAFLSETTMCCGFGAA